MKTYEIIKNATLEIIRPLGNVEIVTHAADGAPLVNRLYSVNYARNILPGWALATKNANRGIIAKAILDVEITTSNIDDLMTAYNRVANEGGEGYVPDGDYFRKHPKFLETIKTEQITINL